MEVQPEIIYSAFAALAAAVIALWKQILTNEASCQRKIDALWEKLFEVRSEQHIPPEDYPLNYHELDL